MMLSSVDLPAAGRAEQDDELASRQVEVDAAQRVHLDLAHVVDLRELLDVEDDDVRETQLILRGLGIEDGLPASPVSGQCHFDGGGRGVASAQADTQFPLRCGNCHGARAIVPAGLPDRHAPIYKKVPPFSIPVPPLSSAPIPTHRRDMRTPHPQMLRPPRRIHTVLDLPTSVFQSWWTLRRGDGLRVSTAQVAEPSP